MISEIITFSINYFSVMLVDIAISSGTGAATKAVMEMINNGDVSHTQMATIFMTLPNTLISPGVVKNILVRIEIKLTISKS